MSISKVDLSVFGKVNFEGLSLLDYKLDTMLDVSSLRGNLDRLDLVGGIVKVDDLFLINPYVSVKIYDTDTISNFDIFLNKLKVKKDTIKKEKTFDFKSAGINVKNLSFKYEDQRAKRKQKFDISNLDLVVNSIQVNPTDVRFNINELSFLLSNGFNLKKFKGDFTYSATNILIENIELKTPNSSIYSDLRIDYPSIDHIVKKSPDVKLDFEIRYSEIGLKDIGMFVKGIDTDDEVKVSMKANGNVDKLIVSEIKLKTANKTELVAKMDLRNILSRDNFTYFLDIYKLSSNYGDLIDLLPPKIEKSVPSIIEKLGNFDLTGKTTFKYKQIKTDILFDSEVGKLLSQLEVTSKSTIEEASYKGEITVEDFDMREFLENERLGFASLSVKVDGSGFSLEKLDTFIEGKVTSFHYNGYEYNNIEVDGNVSNELFVGNLDIKDENIELSFNGLVDVGANIPKYKFDVFIDKADLVKTNIFTRDSIAFLEGTVSIDLEGKTVDDIVGSIELDNFVYQNENDLYYFDRFNITSEKKDLYHTISVSSSDIVDGEIEGEFYFGDIINVFENAIGSNFKNYEPKKVRGNQNLEFDISIKNKIIDIFVPSLRLYSGTKIVGSIDSESNRLKLKFDSPGIKLNDIKADSITLWVDNQSDFFNTLLKVKEIDNGKYSIHDLNLALVNDVDSIMLTAKFVGGDSLTESYDINAYQTMSKSDELVFGLLNSKLTILDHDWIINPNNNKRNKFILDTKTKDFKIDSISIASGLQKILLGGIKEGEDQKYYVNIDDIDIEEFIKENSKINPKGKVNADLTIEFSGKTIKPVANIKIDSLMLDSHFMGDLKVGMQSDEDNGVYKTSVLLYRHDIETLNADGIVDLSREIPSLDIDVNLDKLKLDFINVFTKKLFSDIGGYASGDVNVSGPLKNPDLNGFLDMKRVSIGVDYLGVGFNMEGSQHVTVKDHLITIPSLTIRDSEKGTKGTLVGTIKNYDNYKHWDLDLSLSGNKLLVLNTTEDENPLYYGTVYTSGNFSIKGPTSSLKFDISARTEKGTVFSIPLQNSRTVAESDFIHFIPPTKYLTEKEIEELEEESVREYEVDLFRGMDLTFNLEVTPDAVVEIVLDEQVGDVMKGRGNGVFKLDIDTKGDFTMNGTYIITDGEYLFTMQNLINKKFKVKQGGTIVWNGSPTDAILNMEAVYKTKTQVASYLDYAQGESYNKLLVNLILKLDGPLMKPDISFDIKMPDAEASLQSQLEMKLNESEEERSRQFIMLITLNSFASSTTDISIGGSVASSTAELVANQLSNIASGISDKFDVNVSYTTGSATSDINSLREDSDELEVGLSSQLFDDRVTVNGNVGVPVGSSQSSIVGDVEILVNITKDGRYKGKVFTRQNVVTDLFESEGYTQGIGISYQTNFDTFKEFLDNLFRRNVKNTEEKLPSLELEQDTTTVKFK
ncbi:MAG: translocation/assembly module TamB domain-containing protein [Flavobacteriales bacterium]|nr:translocation/assembly module TamB domain-containing protein [Flavobacteriales bacterium]